MECILEISAGNMETVENLWMKWGNDFVTEQVDFWNRMDDQMIGRETSEWWRR